MDSFLNFLIGLPGLLANISTSLFEYIFPEYPPLGVVLLVVSTILFLIYIFKSGFGAAFKIFFMMIFGVSFGLFVLHSIIRILNLAV